MVDALRSKSSNDGIDKEGTCHRCYEFTNVFEIGPEFFCWFCLTALYPTKHLVPYWDEIEKTCRIFIYDW